MALMSAAELAKIRKNLELSRQTENTLTHWAALDANLAEVRKSGLAYDCEETSVGICAIAKALRSPSDELIAISIPVPSVRFWESQAELIQAIEQEFANLVKKLS
jgi:IclR family transcriptional regulator, acetate operon repressor